jgi:hypothetical protein
MQQWNGMMTIEQARTPKDASKIELGKHSSPDPDHQTKKSIIVRSVYKISKSNHAISMARLFWHCQGITNGST